nr:integrase, catalytic region, zinc finger, CCHC-type, peptidase aspartic, catalytic [Tanacetum cinerariifolium]
MNTILGVYIELDEVTNLQCDYLEMLEKCECLEKELSKRVIPTTSVSIPQLKSNPMEDRVMLNNSQTKKQGLEDHRRNVKFSKNKTSLVEIIIFIIDSGCSKHMTGNLKLLINFMEKFMGTVKFGNDQIAPILGYGNLVQGAITIKKVYYVEGRNHNLFSVGQFCDADLEVAFWKSTWYIRDLKGNDLLTGSRGTDLYSITLQDTSSPNPIYLMAKVTSSQAWLCVSPGSESRPPMLNKENYVPWSSRFLRYAKSRPNEKLIHNSILNGPYIEANDQAIQTILLGLPKDIYAAVDSCETAQKIWLRV